MNLMKSAGFLVAAVALTFAAAPADAAPKRRVVLDSPTRITVIDETGRARTRITVRRRSFLDPGTETLPLDQHYHDYAFPPTYSIYPDRNDWKGSFSRMPLPGPFDVPGYRSY